METIWNSNEKTPNNSTFFSGEKKNGEFIAWQTMNDLCAQRKCDFDMRKMSSLHGNFLIQIYASIFTNQKTNEKNNRNRKTQ